MLPANWKTQILDFWFGELTPADWFSGGEETDRRIRDRMGGLFETLKTEPPTDWKTDPKSALAMVIAFDQFPRNLFRRKPEAFATDGLALEIARHAVSNEMNSDFSPEENQFLYMPFMHSEVHADQELCVALFKALASNADAIKFAEDHRDIIQRFGRFPHRNRVLGRLTTPEEEKFIAEHAGYGQ